MAIRLTFDVIGSTCGDLLRFADAARAAGVPPEQPLRQSSGPFSFDVMVGNGHATGPFHRRPGAPAEHWAAALDAVLRSDGVDESVKASLRTLREAVTDQPPTIGGS